MLIEFGNEIWLADGPSVSFMGFPYPTRMAIVRLADGGLWVWSPVALEPRLADAVAALGPVCHLVAPNKLHHLSLGAWAERFPDAQCHAGPGLARKRPDLRFDSELGDDPPSAWAGEIDQVVFRGSLFMHEVVFFHRASQSVLVCDLVQRFEPGSVRGLRGLVMRLWGLVGEHGSTPREWRASFWNRRATRAALQTALAWHPERMIVAHGRCAERDGAAALAHGLRWLGAS